MNLENIKREGYQLGLEAELGAQFRSMDQYIKESKYSSAMQCCANCAKLLEELTFVTRPSTPQNLAGLDQPNQPRWSK